MGAVLTVVKGQRRVIRDIRHDTPDEFEAFYRGCHIIIVPMAERRLSDPKRWSLSVAGKDGCLLADTWEYARDKTRAEMIQMALENIL